MPMHLVRNADISQFAHINANVFAFIKLIAHALAYAIIKNKKRNTKMYFLSNQTYFHL